MVEAMSGERLLAEPAPGWCSAKDDRSTRPTPPEEMSAVALWSPISAEPTTEMA